MKDFIKIFIGISALAGSFVIGRNYGEKTYLESAERRDIIKATEELNYAKAELENAKTKLQNIADQAQNKKTEELLTDILNVFLVDLGIQIQNKDAILKQAKSCAETKAVTAAPTPTPAVPEKKEALKKQDPWVNAKINKFKSNEWILQNSNGAQGAFKNLKNVQIKNMNSFLDQADDIEGRDCEAMLGSYKGSVKNINNKHFGSLAFELKQTAVNKKEGFYGKTAWYNNNKVISEKIKNSCGKKVKGTNGRILDLGSDKYVQIYKLNSADKFVGNFYEVLPNGTTKVVGSFILNRVDRF